ncbi:MAG: hypothetical protein ABI113_01565 [Mucilaginibacter sp.]
MKIDFDNISEHVIPMDDFSLKWRFTEEKYDKLPELHLSQLKPLDDNASMFLWHYIAATKLHDNFPFKQDFFRAIDKAKILTGNKSDVMKWLYQRGLAFDKEVYLSWQPSTAMMVPWEMLIKYFDAFYYPSSDDLTVIDQSLTWALLFYHENEIYFGTNKDFVPSETFADIEFLWLRF